MDTDSIAREIADVNRTGRKPIVCNLMTDKRQWVETLRILRQGGVPCYSFPETAARALISMVRYGELVGRDSGEVRIFDDVDRDRALEMIRSGREGGYLSQADVNELLEAYGIPVASWRMADDADGALKAAGELGYPVCVKVDSSEIVHKSDVGGVAVDITDEAALREVLDEMASRFDPVRFRFFVQKFISGGREVIIGAKREKGLGHLLMVGTGGVLVELLKDAAFGIAPVTGKEAGRMLRSLKLYPLLSGFRGQKGVDLAGIVEIMERVSQMVTDLPEIEEMDLNPVFAFAKGTDTVAVDARIRL